ncbi:hypothetical protein KO500_11630 [Cellulophaga baltica]|uniref:hypothetical protein n=1 Tax=Cellulophaga TaxID=104264 RepID=UPI001C068AE2|nr:MULTISPECIES: hypothetical protein [Cellulophaga]MBU2997089.1 hypothetical protein [Cellulophaga baltica]MDO6768487.1 hypothetical protein [Cellulophaga sp. 1_MG-2023]
MDNKEQWAGDVLNSLSGIEKATPNIDLFAKITAQLPQEKMVNIIPLQRLSWVAVAASIIIAANIYVFSNKIKSTETIASVKTELIKDYSLYTKY